MADAPPLLGGTFLRNFTYKMSPETGRVTLTKVDTGDTRPARKPTKPARAKGFAGKP